MSSTLAILPTADPRRIAERLIAFANADGGTIVIGFDERGKQIARIAPDEIELALREAVTLCTPIVRATLEVNTSSGGGPSHVINVPRSKAHHQLRTDHVTPSTVAPAFEDEPAPSATLDDLDSDVIDEFVRKREERTRRKIDGDVSTLLREIGALTANSAPTVAGILLFGKNPSMFIKGSGVVFVKFPGIDMRAEGGAMGYGRREEINGPLSRVVERVWQVVFEEMRVGAVVRGKQREDVLEYPELAVREALVNAICHRDYSIQGRRIEVRKFADRLEVISPGGLAGYMTLDNLIEEHYSRNPRLVHGLYHWGYIEELGLGVDRMIEEMTTRGQPPPKFEDKQHSFKVTLSNYAERGNVSPPIAAAPIQQNNPAISAPSTTVAAPASTLGERQARAIDYIAKHGRITNSDYQTLCPDVSAETLRTDLAELVRKGTLMRVGEKKGTYYILK